MEGGFPKANRDQSASLWKRATSVSDSTQRSFAREEEKREGLLPLWPQKTGAERHTDFFSRSGLLCLHTSLDPAAAVAVAVARLLEPIATWERERERLCLSVRVA